MSQNSSQFVGKSNFLAVRNLKNWWVEEKLVLVLETTERRKQGGENTPY